MYACGIQIIFSVQLYEVAATLKKNTLSLGLCFNVAIEYTCIFSFYNAFMSNFNDEKLMFES